MTLLNTCPRCRKQDASTAPVVRVSSTSRPSRTVPREETAMPVPTRRPARSRSRPDPRQPASMRTRAGQAGKPGCPGQQGAGEPAGRGIGPPADLEQRWAGWAGHAFHHDLGHLRGGILHRPLNGQPHGHRRGRAAVATALQAEVSHPVGGDAEAVQPARMRSKVGPDTVECALDECIYVIRMEIVQEQQALGQRIGEQAITHRGPGRPFGVQDAHDLPQMPPAFGQPPTPLIHPRLGTLHSQPPGQARESAEHDLLDARLGGRRKGNRVPRRS
jgi:hypothetical protein